MILGELEGMLIFWIFETLNLWFDRKSSERFRDKSIYDAVCLRCCFRLKSLSWSQPILLRIHRLHTDTKDVIHVASRFFTNNKFALVYKTYCSPRLIVCRFLLRSRDWQHNYGERRTLIRTAVSSSSFHRRSNAACARSGWVEPLD